MKVIKNTFDKIFVHVNVTSRSCNFVALIFSLLAVGAISGFISGYIAFLYLPVCVVALVYVLTGGIDKVNLTFVAMYVVFLISALMSNETRFSPVSRFALFFIITLLCGPCIYSTRAVLFRTYTFRYIMVLLSILTVGSFFAYFLGINYMLVFLPKNVNLSTSGIFSGLYTHSMLLGPFSAIVSILFLNAYLLSKKNLFIVIFFFSASGVVLSASRGAVLALCVPILFILLFNGVKRKKLFILIFSCLLISIPFADGITSGLVKKQENNIRAGGTLSSRDRKWDNRLSEFNDNPFFGIGFGAVDSRNHEDYSDASIEPGSSHLSVLSMTGCFGMSAYCMVILHSFNCVRREKNIIALNIMCMFIAMIIHATFEGYALFGGSLLCFIYWLIIGQCVDYHWLKRQGLLCAQ